MSLGKMEKNVDVCVPILGDAMRADYAYQNGALNLIKSVGLPEYDDAALKAAREIGSKGLLIAKHGVPSTHGGSVASKLIVVGRMSHRSLASKVEQVLKDHEVRFVELEQITSLVEEVRREAH